MLMDNPKTARIGWIVAAVFFGISLILFIMLLDERDPRNFDDVRAQISKDCTAGTAQGDSACASALRDIEALLVEIRIAESQPANVEVTPIVPTATATPVL